MKLFVVILNWNGKKDTLACLKSLEGSSCEIVVVDNGSTDDSATEILSSYPDITLISTGENLGFAGGNNVGIKYALEQSAESILLLNNDTIVDPQFITALQEATHSSEHDVIGAYPLRYSDADKLDHLGGIWNPQTATFDLVGLSAPQGFRTHQDLDYVCGCSILVRREVFEKIGLLEPTFFLFWEEADFCMRAKKAGFKIGVCYDAKLLHKVSASFVGGTPHKTYFWWRGRLLWMERNCAPDEKKRLMRQVLRPQLRHLKKLQILKTLQSFFRSDEQKKLKLLQYRAALQGYDDFRNRRFGNGPAWLFKKVL